MNTTSTPQVKTTVAQVQSLADAAKPSADSIGSSDIPETLSIDLGDLDSDSDSDSDLDTSSQEPAPSAQSQARAQAAWESFDDDEDNATIEIFKPECLGCGHLVPFVDHKYKKCHFSRGNTHCPAQSVQIQVRIPAEEIAQRFITAERIGDNLALARLYTKLASKPEWAQKRIKDTISRLRGS